jgi:mxaD protein
MKSLMRNVLWVLAACAAIQTVWAHGPTPQKVEERITIAAPPAKVWDVIKNFGNIASWHPGVEKAVAEGGNGTGATRTITLKTGDLGESLDEYNAGEMSFGYRLAKENVDVFPVSFYSMMVSVKPADGGSEVEWISRLYRADTTNEPPDDKNDAAAVKATTDFIKQGLEALKAKVEGKG